MEHIIKCWPEHFEALHSGKKKAELRKFDRPYQVGDTLLIREFMPAGHYFTNGKGYNNPQVDRYTGREIKAEIGHILYGDPELKFGLMYGWVLLSIEKVQS